jgi:hypothetical protein
MRNFYLQNSQLSCVTQRDTYLFIQDGGADLSRHLGSLLVLGVRSVAGRGLFS